MSNKINISLLASEAVTFKYIKAKSTISILKVYIYRQALLLSLVDKVNINITILRIIILISLIF